MRKKFDLLLTLQRADGCTLVAAKIGTLIKMRYFASGSKAEARYLAKLLYRAVESLLYERG